MKLDTICSHVRKISRNSITPKVCIVGAGPAGFYAAKKLLTSSDNIKVDMLERLPVPYGLVRFGVAPDHPEVKNVIHTFHKTALHPNFQFIGNVDVGKDVTMNELQELYHAVLLTYGAEEDRVLNVPGENLSNVISGRRFVGWYNGIPADSNLKINLDTEDAVILGQGNVAIDIARILLTPIDKLKYTDITSFALEQLSRSKVRRVWLVGRRGPLQAAFTTAELREILRLDGCKTYWREEDFEGINEAVLNTLSRQRKRLTQLMLKSMQENLEGSIPTKELRPVFLRSPVEFLGSDVVTSVKLSKNKLEGSSPEKVVAIPTEEFEEINCGIAFRSIGYKSVPIDSSVPFNHQTGCVKNVSGKVEQSVYAGGWVATGPVGVIASTMVNATQVGTLIAQELSARKSKPGSTGLHEILDKMRIRTVSYSDWEKIDLVERERGKKLGKPREKIINISEMLEIAWK